MLNVDYSKNRIKFELFFHELNKRLNNKQKPKIQKKKKKKTKELIK